MWIQESGEMRRGVRESKDLEEGEEVDVDSRIRRNEKGCA